MAFDTAVLRKSFSQALHRNPELPERFFLVFSRVYRDAGPKVPRSPARDAVFTQSIQYVLHQAGDQLWLLHALGERRGALHALGPGGYVAAAQCLLVVLREALADEWTPRMTLAWAELLSAAAEILEAGAARAREPAKQARLSA